MNRKDPSKKKYYSIGVVAKMYNIHPQTLRLYEREGLIKPERTKRNTRLYSEEDLARLETILNLTRDMGVNLAGVDVVLNLLDKIEEMKRQFNLLLQYLQEELHRDVENIDEKMRTALVRAPRSAVIPVEEWLRTRDQPSTSKERNPPDRGPS